MRLIYISHPEVAIDPAVPPPDWGLSARGIARATGLALRCRPPVGARLIASAERKAQDCAQILGYHWGLAVQTDPAMGEIDRSATGFVPHALHEALADRLFAHPTESAAGWERAVAAQARILRAVESVRGAQDLILVGHGGVGSLLWCALTERPISRAEDQPGQGHVWQVQLGGATVNLHPWQRFEATLL